MSGPSIEHPHGTQFDAFLYAPVGDDQNGFVVTVLSALARLGLDPWKEASELGALPREAARSRLGALLASFRDVPAMVREHAATSDRLTRLLPERMRQTPKLPGTLGAATQALPLGAIIAVSVVLLILAQLFFFAPLGAGG
ncbi:hypothetical protein [Pararhodobacter zhoushanensis]|uniref:Uncharacterized protein n=1 Tax=Pararhodobacter zhoushanensis TaxID=2479545 RepID=A0ABT3GU05_9RHOB|nr:hypothetical protein [Pararhodobacter zhoushanensis]MCW1931017.1 hypothetical protein [Pararhodobacter zhoushanensis]